MSDANTRIAQRRVQKMGRARKLRKMLEEQEEDNE